MEKDKYNIFNINYGHNTELIDRIFNDYLKNKPIMTMLKSFYEKDIVDYKVKNDIRSHRTGETKAINGMNFPVLSDIGKEISSFGRRSSTQKMSLIKKYLDKIETNRYEILGKFYNTKHCKIEYKLSNGDYIDINEIENYLDDHTFDIIKKMLEICIENPYIFRFDPIKKPEDLLEEHIKEIEIKIQPMFRRQRLEEYLAEE